MDVPGWDAVPRCGKYKYITQEYGTEYLVRVYVSAPPLIHAHLFVDVFRSPYAVRPILTQCPSVDQQEETNISRWRPRIVHPIPQDQYCLVYVMILRSQRGLGTEVQPFAELAICTYISLQMRTNKS